MSRTMPVPRWGSKYNELKFLHSRLPRTPQFVLPFGGSGVTLWNREPVEVETWNDIDGELHHFMWTVLRHGKEFKAWLDENAWYGRELFNEAFEAEPQSGFERAFFFLVRNAQAFNAVGGNGWASSIATTRRGKSQRIAAWDHRKEMVLETFERMHDERVRDHVQIENRPAVDVIERHDREDTTFYCDPPYPPQARETTGEYHYEMDEQDHRELASALGDIDGCAAVSGYECPLMEELYEGWYKHTSEEKVLAGEGTGSRQEILYTNYDPAEFDSCSVP